MDYIYAQLDENNVCMSVSQLAGSVLDEKLIPLDSYDTSILGWRYIDGEWLEPLPPSEQELIMQEIQEINTKLKQMYEDEKYNEWLGITTVVPQTFSLPGLPGESKPSTKEQLVNRMMELNNLLSMIG